MPITVNGIGTSYHGKRNQQVLPGTCESCGATVALRSYDTTSYFVVAYLPVLPLGKKRILAECPQCQRHRVASLADWTRRRDESLASAIESVRESPTDRDAVRDALDTAVGSDDEGACLEIATLAEEHHRDDPDVLRTLGDAYAYFHHHADAEQMYRTAIDLAPDETLDDALALALMRQGRPDDAAPLVEPVFTSESADRIDLAHLLVEAYQTQGISAPDDRYEIRTGELLYEFAGLDYEFEAFPQEISMSRATEKRQRVDLLDEFTPGGTVMLLATELPPVDRDERVRRYLEDSLRFDPDCAECREALEAWVSGDDTTNTAAVGTP